MTNNQYQSFYGAPWLLYELGATHTPGHMLTQVCATGPRVLFAAAAEVQTGMSQQVLALNADRCSNGYHIYYPIAARAGRHRPVGGAGPLQHDERRHRRPFDAEDGRERGAQSTTSRPPSSTRSCCAAMSSTPTR